MLKFSRNNTTDDITKLERIYSAMTMYALKPIISLTGGDIYKPKSMYELKNIHDPKKEELASNESSKIVSDITEQVIKFLKNPLPEVAQLEIRQEKILAQLAELKKQVSSLCGILKSSSQSKSVSTCTRGNKEKISANFVLNANPSKPPFSILALQKIWKDTDIKVSSHVHSTGSPPSLEFPLAPSNSNSNNNSVELSLIWKKVSDLEVVISGVHGAPLLGEVNFLRYVSRLVESQNYESSACQAEASKIDSVLDLCHELSFLDSAKDLHPVLSTLGSKLGSGRWLGGKEEPSIADAAAWSVIKRLGSGKLPGNISSWFTRCDDFFWRK